MIATTRRHVRSASTHDWGGRAWSAHSGTIEHEGVGELDVLDRVGSGDAFTAGLIHGLMTGRPLSRSLALAVAHGALVMTTPGDTSPFGAADVERLAAGSDPTIER